MDPRVTTPTPGDTAWFTNDRFGLFIHWGIYSLGARREWLRHRERLSIEDYNRRYFEHFDPDLFDPAAWARAAGAAGMKYFVVTTKHHDGFCLWDSAHTEYKAPNTPCGRDLLRPLLDAFRDEGLKVGLYHSLIDWHHPDYTLDWTHPMRDNEKYRAAEDTRRIERYTAYLHAQVEELLSNYGTIDILWFDFSPDDRRGFAGKGREEWQSEKLIALARRLQPGILINDRLRIDQDIKTPEQLVPREWVRVDGKPVVWEACHTVAGAWGYDRDGSRWKSTTQLISLLIECVSKGGNLLLNVGPTGRGEIDERSLERLEGIGRWMHRHGRSVYGCTQAPACFPCPPGCLLTFNAAKNRLYIHVLNWPCGMLHLPGTAPLAEYAQLLHDASEIPMLTEEVTEEAADPQNEVRSAELLSLKLPAEKPDTAVPVIELFLKDRDDEK